MKALIPLTLALGVIGGSALAQSPLPSESQTKTPKKPPSERVDPATKGLGSGARDPAGKSMGNKGAYTKDEKTKARSERLSDTAHENKAGNLEPGGETGTDESTSPPEPGKAYTKDERKQAKTQRRADTGKENKAGNLPPGGERGAVPTK